MLSLASSLSLPLLSSPRCAQRRHLLVPSTCGLQNQEVLNTDDSLDLWWLGGALQHGQRFAPVRYLLISTEAPLTHYQATLKLLSTTCFL